MRTTHSTSFLAFSLLTLVACAQTSVGDTSTDTGPAPGADLDGTWALPCYAATRTSLTYDALAFAGAYDEYTDDTCTTPVHHSAWGGAATVGNPLESGAWPIDLAFTTFTSVALTEENAALNNQYAYCGYTDWEAGVEKDILGRDCYGFSIPKGGESLDIYLAEGDTLRFGAGAVIGTDLDESQRPTTLDETRVFARQ